ncbi:MAG: S1 RNA-binding domain-containing protein [Acutalibacteraceae bacterium]|nr:S1 RNA-binding domain-containing protein [Acutalibacteraceae bacterium]
MQIEVGQIVEGKITGITNFGVFVDLGDSKSGMVHISEVARSYVTDIHEHVKENDVVKMKVLSIGDDGKISLSIKRAQEEPKKAVFEKKANAEKRQPTKIDSSYTWAPKKQEPASFEEMMNRFKQTSDEKFSDLKRKNPETRRSKRGAGVK